MHPLICASTQSSTGNANEINAASSADLKALRTIQALGFHSYDTLTATLEQQAVAAFFDTASRSFTPSGAWIECPDAYRIMMEAMEPYRLRASEVVALVMTSDSRCMFLPEEWAAVLAERECEARQYRASAKASSSRLSEDARRTRGGRVDRRAKLVASTILPSGYQWVPVEALSHKRKLAMTVSLKRAEARRTRRGCAQPAHRLGSLSASTDGEVLGG